MMDLDLDYLEKRGSASSLKKEKLDVGEEEGGGEKREAHIAVPLSPPEELSPVDTTDLVKVILLGAPAVGKTSIIQQFVWNEFCDTYYPTERRHTYYPSVVINGRLYDLKISDLPPVPYFPVDSLYEWTDFRSYGLRSATAYVLVFDLSNATETFRHIKCLREQMAGSRDMKNVPVVVVGNKHDRIHGPVGIPCPAAPSHPPGSFFGAQSIAQSSAYGLPGTSSSLPSASSQAAQAVAQSGPSHANSLLFHHHQHAIAQQNAIALAESRERRDIANIVKKHWRCGYVECSAKYNWRVVSVFKELMQAVDAYEGRSTPGSTGGSIGDNVPLVPGSAGGKESVRFHLSRHQRTPMVVDNLQDAFDRNKCQVL